MFKYCTLFLLLLVFKASAQDIRSVCIRINKLNNEILNGSIKKAQAAASFEALMVELQSYTSKSENSTWIFPLQGYNYHAIGGTNGNGYSDKGYHYLDGNKHAAHPAHDIFITDKNQDCLDDRTRLPVPVLAVSDGIVIACSNGWDTWSPLRGGRFIWLYHPAMHIFTYYAHNRQILVAPGDVVKQGQKIAEVGRTGFSAYKKRSPTHVHFSAFHIINGLPVPYNSYHELIKAREL